MPVRVRRRDPEGRGVVFRGPPLAAQASSGPLKFFNGENRFA